MTQETCPRCPHGLGARCRTCWPEVGPVLIIDHRGGHPSALDRLIEEQAEYYRGARDLARKDGRSAT